LVQGHTASDFKAALRTMLTRLYNLLSGLFPKNVQAFLVSLLAVLILPLAPLLAEFTIDGRIESQSWTATGVTFTAAIALASRNQLVLILGMVGAALLAFVYGIELTFSEMARRGHEIQPLDVSSYASLISARPAECVIGATAVVHVFERIGRHLIEGKAFLEL